jgi:hypothetical protein
VRPARHSTTTGRTGPKLRHPYTRLWGAANTNPRPKPAEKTSATEARARARPARGHTRSRTAADEKGRRPNSRSECAPGGRDARPTPGTPGKAGRRTAARSSGQATAGPFRGRFRRRSWGVLEAARDRLGNLPVAFRILAWRIPAPGRLLSGGHLVNRLSGTRFVCTRVCNSVVTRYCPVNVVGDAVSLFYLTISYTLWYS